MRKEIKIEGLENIHPISESGAGTVFLGRRTREIESVIKVLPYPVHPRKKEEPHTIVYLREIKRLKHLNQVPNIHVVKILNAGLTEKDSFPFIESEFIKGADLDELLNFPNNAIFKVSEAIDLAAQMADALAHCHTAMVKHGRINNGNIRLNSDTGKFTLLNFGRILLTDEQRREEIKNSRAPEYLAPEQHQGEILFESDIYGLGVILFEVLTGTTPKYKTVAGDPSEAADTLPAISTGQQIKELRKENLPLNWTEAEKMLEMNTPVWLLNIVSICLQQDPSKRYSNGIALQEAIKLHNLPVKEVTAIPAPAPVTKQPDNKPVKPIENKSEDKPLSPIGKTPDDKPKEPDDKDAEIKRLKALIIQKEGQLDVYKYQTADYNPESNKLNIPRPVFFGLLAVIALLGAFAIYSYFFRKPETRGAITTYTDSDTSGYSSDTSSMIASEMYADSLYAIDSAALVKSLPPLPKEEKKTDDKQENETPAKKTEPETVKKKPETKSVKSTPANPQTAARKKRDILEPEPDQNPDYFEPKESRQVSSKYTLAVPKAYFYDKPDIRTRRPIYLSNVNDSELTASEDTNGFIYVVFFNTDREITKGWLRKADLRRIN
ncbi:protein kinase [Flavihumibacter sp. R14]|nr:protein kinase [Flavihumibacter soli]